MPNFQDLTEYSLNLYSEASKFSVSFNNGTVNGTVLRKPNGELVVKEFCPPCNETVLRNQSLPEPINEAFSCSSRKDVINFLEKYFVTEYSFIFLWPDAFELGESLGLFEHRRGSILLTHNDEQKCLFYKIHSIENAGGILQGSVPYSEFSDLELPTDFFYFKRGMYHFERMKVHESFKLRFLQKIYENQRWEFSIDSRNKSLINIRSLSHRDFNYTEDNEILDHHKLGLVLSEPLKEGARWKRSIPSHGEQPKDALDFAKKREAVFNEGYSQGYNYFKTPLSDLSWIAVIAYYYFTWIRDNVFIKPLPQCFGIFPSKFHEDFNTGYSKAVEEKNAQTP